MISIAVTGHRPNKLWGYDLNHNKYKQLESLIIKTIAEIWDKKSYPKLMHQVPIECISGMALGVDTIFANSVLRIKTEFTSLIKLVAAIPCLHQETLWSNNDKIRYRNIISLADEVVYVSKEPYSKGCMNKRNQYMVDRCNILLAIWNGDNTGGTADAIRRAEKADKEIIIIDPASIGGK